MISVDLEHSTPSFKDGYVVIGFVARRDRISQGDISDEIVPLFFQKLVRRVFFNHLVFEPLPSRRGTVEQHSVEVRSKLIRLVGHGKVLEVVSRQLSVTVINSYLVGFYLMLCTEIVNSTNH